MKKYLVLKKDIERNFEGVKIYGRRDSKNLIVGWGSTKGTIVDAIKGLDVKFMQVVYIKPLSRAVRREMEAAKNVILVEGNQTGQLGRLLREATGISIKPKNRILKYDGRPFWRDELRRELMRCGIKEVSERMKRKDKKRAVKKVKVRKKIKKKRGKR
jgi:2-oxoglutarate ferredoxin oxidoreductase subunit alpha